MDSLLHTLLATGCIAAAFYAGRYFTVQSLSEEMVGFTMEKLEDADGDVELIPIAEIIKEDRIANSN